MKFFFAVIVLFVLSGCVKSSLYISELGNIELQYDNKSDIIGTNSLEGDLFNFGNLYVEQYRFTSSDGNVLFSEYVQADFMFDFKYSELVTLMYAFENSTEYELVYERGNIQLVQIQLQSEVYVNALVHASTPQDYYFVYGFSNKEFTSIATRIKYLDTEINQPKYKGMIFNETSKPQTNWNEFLVRFTPLLEPSLGMRGR